MGIATGSWAVALSLSLPLWLGGATAVAGEGPGFDCAQASTPVEHLICESPDLSALDRGLARVYGARRTAAATDAARRALRAEQRAWLRGRLDACKIPATGLATGVDPQQTACLAERYRQRLAELDRPRLLLTKVEVMADQAVPRACLEFDRPLAADLPLPAGDYVRVSGVADVEVSASGKVLCLSGLRHGEKVTAVVRRGLAGTGRAELYEDLSVELDVGNRTPSVAFSEGAYVLPEDGEPLVPVTTVNVDTLGLELYRVDVHNLAGALDDGFVGRRLERWTLDRLRDDEGERVWSGTLAVAKAPNREQTTLVPLGALVDDLKPGVYALAAEAPELRLNDWDERPVQWVLVSDLGLTTYRGDDGLGVQVRSLASAEPVAGVAVRLVARNHSELATATTDGEGWVRFGAGLLKGTGGARPLLVTATRDGGGFVFLSLAGGVLDLSERGVDGRAPLAALEAVVYGERGVYRPGETVQLGLLLRDGDARAVGGLPLTVSLKRPDGKETFRQVVAPDAWGGARLPVPLTRDAPTGEWEVAVYVDPKAPPVGRLAIQVQEFVPERLEVALSADVPLLVTGEAAALAVDARYLFGAPGANLVVEAEAIVERDPEPFAALKGFSFGLPDDAPRQRLALEAGRTDGTGKATIGLTVDRAPDTTAPLRAVVRAAVRDADGRPSRQSLTLPLRAHPALVGLKPLFTGERVEEGNEAGFEVVAVAPDGTPLAGRELVVEWVREDRHHYDWYQEDGRWKSRYRVSRRPLSRMVAETGADGRVRVARVLDGWGYYRLEIHDPAGGAAAGRTVMAGWRAEAQSPDTPDALTVSVDRPEARAGDTLKVFVKGAFAGLAEVVVGNHGVVWRSSRVLPEDGVTVEVPVDDSWGVGAYVLATAYRPGAVADRRGPGRAVGARWVSVGTAARTLDVAFDLPAEVRPSTRLDVPFRVSGERVGQEPVRLAAFAVDEGILQLTRFQTPRPDRVLFARQRLGLELRDLYGRLIRPQEGERGQVRSGGDQAGSHNLDGLSKQVFRTVALGAETVDVGDDGRGTVAFDLPDIDGRLRVFAVAYGATALGGGEAPLTVRHPVVAEVLPPRFLAPGDEAQAALRLHNLSGPAGVYTVTVRGEGAVAVASPPQTFELAAAGRAATRIAIAGTAAGDGRLVLDLAGPEGFRLVRHWDLSVRPAQPWVTRRRSFVLAPGEGHRVEAAALDDFIGGTGEVGLVVSNRPAIDVPALVKDLDRYPYGCLEQTTSRAFPLVFFERLKALWPGVSYDAATLKTRLDDAIAAIIAKQRDDGAFGLWSSASPAEPWLTAYAADFLTRARRLGYTVPEAPLRRALDWMKTDATAADRRNGDARAYMLSVLAREGELAAGDVRYHARRLAPVAHSFMAKGHLVAAWRAIGAEGSPVDLAAAFDPATVPVARARDGSDYGTPLRDLAAVVALGERLGYGVEDWNRAIERLAAEYEGQPYTSTQEKAWLLAAAFAVLDDSGAVMSFTVGGQAVAGRGRPFIESLPRAALETPYDLVNEGDGGLRVVVSETGVPADPQPSVSAGMTIERHYVDPDGEPVDVSRLVQGQRVVVVLSGRATDNLKHDALVVDLLPAGLEIEVAALGAEGVATLPFLKDSLSPVAFEAARDDRYVAAIDLTRERETFRVAYRARAVTPGRYAHPAPQVEDMYKAWLFARGTAGTMTVVADE